MLQLLTRITQCIHACHSLPTVLDRAVEEIRQFLQIDRVLIYRFQPDQSGTVIAESVGSSWSVALGMQIFPRQIPSQIQALSDIYMSDLPQCCINSLAALEVRANLAVPIVVEAIAERGSPAEPQVWGLLVAQHCWEAKEWQEEAIELAKHLALLLGIAIQQADLRERSQLCRKVELPLEQVQPLQPALNELRTPLSSIHLATQTLIDLMENDLLSGEKPIVRRTLYLLQQSCQRQIRLVQNLLTLFEQRAKPMPIALYFDQWVPSIIEPFRSQFTQRQQQFQLQMDDGLPAIVTDPVCLERILHELLDNATRYTPAGETITLTATATVQTFLLKISNSGSEIPKAEQARIFDRFYRIAANDVWESSQTGLGLAIVKTLVDRLGAVIRVESGVANASEQQAAFLIELPLLNYSSTR
jgi:signal transduction histidine kinase